MSLREPILTRPRRELLPQEGALGQERVLRTTPSVAARHLPQGAILTVTASLNVAPRCLPHRLGRQLPTVVSATLLLPRGGAWGQERVLRTTPSVAARHLPQGGDPDGDRKPERRSAMPSSPPGDRNGCSALPPLSLRDISPKGAILTVTASYGFA